MNLFDYEYVTTFWQDFSIADAFGKKAIIDTYHRAFEEWKTNHIYLTELVMVLNHKLWQHYENRNMPIAETYNVLFNEANDYAWENLKDEELQYFMRTTD